MTLYNSDFFNKKIFARIYAKNKGSIGGDSRTVWGSMLVRLRGVW